MIVMHVSKRENMENNNLGYFLQAAKVQVGQELLLHHQHYTHTHGIILTKNHNWTPQQVDPAKAYL